MPRTAPPRRSSGTPSRSRRRRGRSPWRSVVALAVALVIVAGVGLGAWKVWTMVRPVATPAAEGCRVQLDGQSYSLDLEQSNNAAIITAEAFRRGLPARAVTIALATAMQESRLRNLDYGDRDSVGLFQQRPSQGWGTVKQIMDPWYSSGKFYAELVKVSGWRTGDINDVAQAVQRSGVPDGYRKHVSAAKAWSSALTGNSTSMISCVNRSTTKGSASTLSATARKGLAEVATIKVSGATVSVSSTTATTARAGIALLLASTELAPITSAAVSGQRWTAEPKSYATWSASPAEPSASPGGNGGLTTGTVVVTS